ncbi:MAG: hypothetical protein Q4C06_06475 [Bacillota bacterium]|nr:hypothetical protein [Bacillota bacterium]
MAWLGFVTWITIYWCVFLAVTTGRIGWGLLCGWLIPIFAMAVSFEAGMQVNGLMFLICLLMFFACRKGLSEIRGWNIKQRKRHPVLFWSLFFFGFLMMFYSVAQAQIQGYFLNIQGWGSENMPMLRLAVTLVPLLFLNHAYTSQIYTGIDRLRLKQRELILLESRCFIAHETGAEKIARQGYYLEGINNGITYHFQLTKRTFHMLKKEKTLKLQIQTGLFGGIYITELDNPEFFKRVRRMDRKAAKRGMALFLLAAAFGIWLFWFY